MIHECGQFQPLSTTLTSLLSSAAPGPKAISVTRWQTLLYNSANAKCIRTTKQLHAYTITSGLLLSPKSTHLLSLLASAYAVGGQIVVARYLFDKSPDRTFFSYKTMIRMCAEDGSSHKALKLFAEMLESGRYKPDNYTFPFVIRACGDSLLPQLGTAVHGLALVSGYGSDTFTANCLLAMYMNVGDREGAKRVFDTMGEPTIVSWNTMTSGYFRNDSAKEALMLFRKMVDSGVEADAATVVSVLPACGFLKDLELGREVHLLVEKKGLGKKVSVRNALVDMYVKCGKMDEARSVFDKIIEKDVVTWTTMIHGYSLNGDVRSALGLCQLMQFEGVKPNAVTLASLLASCANLPNLKLGKCLHGWALRQRIESDVNVETALIDLYAKCKCMRLSFKVFFKTSKTRTVPWNAILSGCIYNMLGEEAIELFREMLLEGVKPNDATFKSLLPAFAVQADMQQAMSLHSYLIRSGFILRTEIATGLVDIYCKCGNLKSGHRVFSGVPLKKRDIVLWSALIAGYGTHGHGEIALSLFYDMVQSGIRPNEVTFTSVLHACSHAGMVDDGLSLFNFIYGSFPLCLRTNHYTCMVDLLGRAGRLEEAHELIKSMPFQPSPTVWGALLGACAIHENVELGEEAAKWLFALEPENTGNYVLMGNIYAALGRWKDAENVRHRMNEVGLLKSPAHSVIEHQQ
ncbi:pentatricopeptide repeat-containing protein At5g39350-like [Coffea arabica]|uniref:Pentatricopeptide repeat-containing protein At5g39350-like n=1 Tax=Coffea arabica TaxID=13443 RepID=A0A6P6TBC7_COFAR|nr:pentatricopeptide repeat-containing protein At5g39350-like isoform X2 [Coffea arabica]XP_027075197.1 pentatricopeptide repeat-containing protein At5g39350-like isoform X2 [Coffea arabica]